MEEQTTTPPSISTAKPSSLRWEILRQAFLRLRSSKPDDQTQTGIKSVSRMTTNGFNLIPCHFMNAHVEEEPGSSSKSDDLDGMRDAFVNYTLPIDGAPTLVLMQRIENRVNLNDFELCNRYDIDNTGLVCRWPSEDVLAYFCLSHANMFRSKRILELGAGYGLAGLVIAASTDALEVVISDGNPQVVDYIQRNICANSGAFGHTKVKPMILHWNWVQVSNILNSFDIIIASDSTFFKESHEGLARTVKSLLKHSEASEAMFFSPRRGDSLDKFLQIIEDNGLSFSIIEKYDDEVWKRHRRFLKGDDSWPNYDKDHCYPLLVRITF